MNFTNWNGITKATERALRRYSPGILTGLGIFGMINTTVEAVKATPKAMELIAERKKKENSDNLTTLQTVEAAGRCYVLPAVMGGLSILCLIGANSVWGKRNAALATAYQLSESAYKTYREKTIEAVGPKKENQIRDAVGKQRAEEANNSPSVIVMTGSGNTMCYDIISQQKFLSNVESIRKAQNDFNFNLRSEMYISLNEFLVGYLNIKPMPTGDDLGWSIDKGQMDIYFSAQLTDGVPTIVIDHSGCPPTYGFKDY